MKLTIRHRWTIAAAITILCAGGALAISYLQPVEYVSSAELKLTILDPDKLFTDSVQAAWEELAYRKNLALLIQHPRLVLYRDQRERLPLEDVIERMKEHDLGRKC